MFVFIEPKEHVSPSNLDGRLEVLDQTIASVFPRKSLIVPEDVAVRLLAQGSGANRGWPTLESSRGKVVFVLFGRKNHTRAYARGRPRLEGRLMFATGTLRTPMPPWRPTIIRSSRRATSHGARRRTCWCARVPTGTSSGTRDAGTRRSRAAPILSAAIRGPQGGMARSRERSPPGNPL